MTTREFDVGFVRRQMKERKEGIAQAASADEGTVTRIVEQADKMRCHYSETGWALYLFTTLPVEEIGKRVGLSLFYGGSPSLIPRDEHRFEQLVGYCKSVLGLRYVPTITDARR